MTTPKMELNIPVTMPYSGLISIERTQDNVSISKSYMLSKHQNNKTSIIDDVVSKVPTVIALPSLSSRGAKMNYNPLSNANLIKCSTLPKLLKNASKNESKNGLHESNAMSVSNHYHFNIFISLIA